MNPLDGDFNAPGNGWGGGSGDWLTFRTWPGNGHGWGYGSDDGDNQLWGQRVEDPSTGRGCGPGGVDGNGQLRETGERNPTE